MKLTIQVEDKEFEKMAREEINTFLHQHGLMRMIREEIKSCFYHWQNLHSSPSQQLNKINGRISSIEKKIKSYENIMAKDKSTA